MTIQELNTRQGWTLNQKIDHAVGTVEGIRETFIQVANLESKLPKAQRDAITGLVFRVAQTVVNYRAKQEAETKK